MAVAPAAACLLVRAALSLRRLCARCRCRFEHVGASAANLPPAMTCKDFLNGVCTRGASCKFAHDGTPGVGAPPPPQVGAYGCGGGYGGYGGYGTPGGYGAGVHGGGYGGYGSGYGAPPSYGAPPYGGTCAAAGGGAGVCKDFLNGRCQRGAQCRFSHEGTPIAPVREQPVCKDFQNGSAPLRSQRTAPLPCRSRAPACARARARPRHSQPVVCCPSARRRLHTRGRLPLQTRLGGARG